MTRELVALRPEKLEAAGQGARPAPALRLAAAALAVCVAYYVGANVGFLLRLPPATPSVLWPPNSILTAALLLTPTRHWWIYLLAALPAHLVVELNAAWPLALVLGLFLSNCSEALIAAGCVRAFSDAPTRFDTLGRVAAFVAGAGIIAPFASSFLDAAVVAAVKGDPYWLVWRTRFFSNVLTELVVVPAVVIVVSSLRRGIRRIALWRVFEAAFVFLALITAGIIYIIVHERTAVLGAGATPVTLFLPFVFWATVRFGTVGTSVSLFLTALTVMFADAHGRVSLPTLTPEENVLGLQLSLSASAIPLLCLAGLIAERRRAQDALAARLRFEELLSRLSGAFVHLPSDRMGEAFETWLQRIGQLFALDRVLLLRISDDEQLFLFAQGWTAPGVPRPPSVIMAQDFPWTIERLLGEQPVALTRPDDLSEEGTRDQQSLRQCGVNSMLALPLVSGGRVFGGLILETVVRERTWPPEEVGRFRLVAEVFANALARKESEDAVRGSELMKSAILASLNCTVGVLDRDGRIIAVNEDWGRFPPHQSATSPGRVGLGANYLDVYRRAAQQGKRHADEALAGIRAVLDGSRALYALEYPWQIPDGERWYAMSVVPLRRHEGGAVVSHTDVTDQKRAEIEVQRNRLQLAHVTRLSTMGELTASLAHELNQPLTAILANSRAAQRMLDRKPPDLDELRAILADIAEDDKRAASVIQRLRAFLRKSEPVWTRLDLNTVVVDVVKLLNSDSVIRNIAVTLHLDDQPVLVNGDRVQLEQVILNLMLNGMEAMADCGGHDRRLVLRTRNVSAQCGEVSVEDTGPGLRDGAHDQVFEPFYTTKGTGMGMGLAIARSIVEAHHGWIWAENLSPSGAIFHFCLPVVGNTA
jgi:signal transduction histidine kinase/integral membrane sensor domain MASE1